MVIICREICRCHLDLGNGSDRFGNHWCRQTVSLRGNKF